VPAGIGRDDRGVPSVLVVDDHAEFRMSVRALLDAAGFSVVGEAATGAEAIRAAADLAPDVVLLDIRLRDLDGIGVADVLAALPRPPEVILVSSRDRSVYGARLTGARVRGFLAKSDLSGTSLRGLLG